MDGSSTFYMPTSVVWQPPVFNGFNSGGTSVQQTAKMDSQLNRISLCHF